MLSGVYIDMFAFMISVIITVNRNLSEMIFLRVIAS
jgi:hypothetical protein